MNFDYIVYKFIWDSSVQLQNIFQDFLDSEMSITVKTDLRKKNLKNVKKLKFICDTIG